MALNLLTCQEDCHKCIKSYAKKHDLGAGDTFKVKCKGIPKSYISEAAAAQIESPLAAETLLDPVKWAAEVLDWHCLDPDGEVWKRKDPDEYAQQMEENPGRASKYHRPYQATILRCSAKRKILRIGRQAGKSESLVVLMLFFMFTHQNFKIVLITPYQSQIDLIFKRLEELIAGNSMLANSVRRSVKAPQYTLELHNNSIIRGFTAGTKSGGGAGAARGQSADMLVFDEADYLSPPDVDAALSIITNYPNAMVWMSSTPTGKREKFYDLCHNEKWKEYHFSSKINPNWSEELDSDFRAVLTEIGYEHEVMANFGEQEAGVFQVRYVEAAQEKYSYEEMAPQSGWLYSIGVDWNSPKIGSTINVLGFNPAANKFQVVHREVIQRAGWTQTAACERIAELNRYWNPFSIYIDSGYGAMQHEILRGYGFAARRDLEKGPQHPDAKLVTRVKAYNFGTQIETRDPFTKQIVKKPSKGFLVENTVRRFEVGDIIFPATDEQLKAELLNYIIKRVSDNGHVIYGMNNEDIGDHNLDALMLATVAFTLEKSSFSKATVGKEGIAFTNLKTPSADKDSDVFFEAQLKAKQNSRKTIAAEHRPQEGRDEFGEDPIPIASGKPASPAKQWTKPGWESDTEHKFKGPPKKRKGRGGIFKSKQLPPSRSRF